MEFRAHKTPIDGLLIIEPKLFTDERGYFMESYRKADFVGLGIEVDFVQDNQSRSCLGTLRGLHFQKTNPQAKLVRALSGKVFDVAVDLRSGSPTFGKWHAVTLDADSKKQFYIPAGFAHGFLALTDGAEFAYKCSAYYDAVDEGGIFFDDPEIGIDWPLQQVGQPLLSDKDKRLPRLRDLGFSF
ncbi:MAG TPA: dTDP-4-dehydrorhamnose 3,5-epimerase [Myxococcota bacterium]|nr:dTDP-4-dehydrorhamnose 3,5-epimerase [Myxococcota bacterium]